MQAREAVDPQSPSRRSVCALRSGKEADDMARNITYLLEQAETTDAWSGGLSYDFAKCFDHIIPSMAISVLLYRGAPLTVCDSRPPRFLSGP